MDKKDIGELPESPGVYFFKVKKTPIYIGKAKNLKNRVLSYFNLHLLPKTKAMVNSATDFSYIKVSSELEALLLEAKLINKFQPKYNSVAKDDKHPLYIVITKEEFPRILSVRKLYATPYALYATYGPFPNSKTVYSVLKMLRRIFPYSDHKIGKRKCLYAHIGLCNPCPNEILKIKNQKLKIQATNKYIQNIRNIKMILNRKIKFVENSLYKKMQTYSKEHEYESAIVVRDQIKRLAYITQPIIPANEYLKNPNLSSDIKNLEIKNLLSLLNKNLKLKIKNLFRVECFDIAHLSGVSPTASMVVFVDGEASKKDYRHFKVRQIKSQSDYDSMEEIAKRRVKHFDDWGRPDLIIVDGGLGQVNKFTKVIKDVPIIGIAKNPDRIVFPDGKKVQGVTLQLISRIRDEAHRFARRLHHKNLRKNLLI